MRAASHFPFRTLLLIFLHVLGLSLIAGPAGAHAVDDWHVIARQAIVVTGARGGAVGTVEFAYVHVAIYDAVNAIDGRYKPFAITVNNAMPWASEEAATAAAASGMLKWMFPAQAASLDATYAAYLATLPAGAARDAGVVVGSKVAAGYIAIRNGDGRNAAVPYSFDSGVGVYQLTPNCPAIASNPVAPWLGQLRPFGIETPWQFRADGPPSLGSDQYAEDLNEVMAYGRASGSLRTRAETELGQFYAENPASWTSRNVANISLVQHLSLADSARYFAQMFVTIGDALITTWNSKYYFNFWRPGTAISGADDDGNVDTAADPTWTPLVPTPCHPEYPAGHGAATGGLALGLEQFFGTKRIDVTLTSTSVPGKAVAELHYDNTRDIIRGVIDARILGGMHYRTSGVHGSVIANKVAHYIARNYFQPVDRRGR